MSTRPTSGRIAIEHVVPVSDRLALGPELDAIFFPASTTKSFPDETARLAFRERWLGRYLSSQGDHLLVARDLKADRRLAGYLVATLDNPGLTTRFADIGYFRSVADLTERFPAHLHVNLQEDYRNQGLGSELITVFLDVATELGCPGVHVVTSATSRNIPFYTRNGFANQRQLEWADHEIVFLGRTLSV